MGIAGGAVKEVAMSGSPDQPRAPIGQTPERSRQLRALHERFVTDPVNTDLSSLRPVIAQSWMRSLQWNVSPGLRTFEQYRQPRVDEQLLRCAKPVLDDLERMSADTGVSIYLADQDGTIAAVLGEAQRAGAERVAAPGTVMSEDITGTNSDGTALEEGRPVQVWGAEHFCDGMQHLYCTSVPVFDPLRRSVRAVLSLSMPERLIEEADARSMALIAQGAAAELTQLLAARLAVREQALLASYLAETRKRGADSVVVMDDRTTIAC
jgi:transcriptional regulator of acetoin/glycerol metabolism